MRVLGRPVKFTADFFGAGDEGGGIAGAPGGFDEGNIAAGNAAGGGEDFKDAEADAGAEIVDALIGVLEGVEDEEVRLREIVDMDVVANTGAVRRGIVGAEDRNRAGCLESGAENVWDEMGFGFVAFGVAVPRAGGVEITEDSVAESVNLAEPFQDDFGLQLGLAVWIDRKFGCVLANGNGLRKAKDRTGRGKHKAHDLVAEAGFEESECGGRVIAEIEGGVLHGLGDFGESGEVHDGVDRRFGEELVEESGVGNVTDDEMSGGRDRRAVPTGEVVEYGDLKVVLQ